MLLAGLRLDCAAARAEFAEMIVAAPPIGVWACAPDGTALSMELQVERGEREGASWQRVNWVDVVHPADRARVSAAWQRFVESGRTGWTARYRVIASGTGDERSVEERGVRLAPGTAVAFVGMAEDVTDRTATASEVRHLAAEQGALQRVAACVAARPEAAGVAELVSREVAQLFEAEAGGVVRFEHHGPAVLSGWWAHDPATLAVGDPIDLTVPTVVGGVQRTGRAARAGWAPPSDATTFTIAERVAVPINVAGRVWGALVIVSAERITSDAEVRLQRFAELVALAISEVDAREALQARIAQQAAVNELSVLALGRGDLDDLLCDAVDKVSKTLAVDAAYVVQGLEHGKAVARAATGGRAPTSASTSTPRPTR